MTKIELELRDTISEEFLDKLVTYLHELDVDEKFNLTVTTDDGQTWGYQHE